MSQWISSIAASRKGKEAQTEESPWWYDLGSCKDPSAWTHDHPLYLFAHSIRGGELAPIRVIYAERGDRINRFYDILSIHRRYAHSDKRTKALTKSDWGNWLGEIYTSLGFPPTEHAAIYSVRGQRWGYFDDGDVQLEQPTGSNLTFEGLAEVMQKTFVISAKVLENAKKGTLKIRVKVKSYGTGFGDGEVMPYRYSRDWERGRNLQNVPYDEHLFSEASDNEEEGKAAGGDDKKSMSLTKSNAAYSGSAVASSSGTGASHLDGYSLHPPHHDDDAPPPYSPLPPQRDNGSSSRP